ncbi:pyridoxamine phosphate oxidase [Moniliophthora roreri MCA 2997]|uniref:Pyridoxamine phosphate oxidase n=1 Tax=Moniliophthora roreri (strain MCA 2997) TaxID=1381753 RepID=V2YMA5_MONRO|nr:pyridoxamine phosphate oxidase [Moniliophthora roreri MCA 2997]
MGQSFEEIPPFLIDWIKLQHIFWVSTAPLSADGHVNLSGKGNKGNFHIVNSQKVWYEDLTGSGCETISHLRENGRITIYFNAFEGPPRIARLLGKGTVYEFGTPEYNSVLSPEQRSPGSRAVIMIDVHKVATSCGYAIPFFEFKSHRPKYDRIAIRFEDLDITAQEEDIRTRGGKGLKAYWVDHSQKSIDGLPAMNLLPETMDTPFILSGNAASIREALKNKARETKTKVGTIEQVAEKHKVVPNAQLLIGFVLGVLVVTVWHRVSLLGERLGFVIGL